MPATYCGDVQPLEMDDGVELLIIELDDVVATELGRDELELQDGGRKSERVEILSDTELLPPFPSETVNVKTSTCGILWH